MKKERIYEIVFLVWICIFILWEVFVRVFEVPNFLLPGPLEIAGEIGKNYPRLFFHLWQTLLEVIGGLGLALAAGIILSVISVHFTIFEIIVFSLIVGLMTVPKISIAPLLLIVLGFDIWPKIILSAFMGFFPIVINTTKGLKGVDSDVEKKDWLKVYRANRREVFFRVRIPNALPDFFAGLETAVPLSVIGAIVGEFTGSHRGLGYLILQAQASFNIALMFACIITLSLMGITLFGLVKFAEWLSRVNRVNGVKIY